MRVIGVHKTILGQSKEEIEPVPGLELQPTDFEPIVELELHHPLVAVCAFDDAPVLVVEHELGIRVSLVEGFYAGLD